MINELIIGISQCLDIHFTDIEIFIDEMKQGIVAPCFFIQLLNAGQEQIVGNRYHREQSFDVHYFPKNSTSELNNMSDQLMNALEYIEVEGGLVRGTKMHSEVVDGVLHFFVDFNLIITKQKHDEFMEKLKIKERVKIIG